MNWQLIRTAGPLPPGGYQFSDAITGKQYRDMGTLFNERVAEIIRDRNANHRLFQDNRFVTFEHVAKELSEQICTRLKNNRHHCTNGLPTVRSVPATQAAPVVTGKTCRYCGSTNLTEVLCATCSGRKVTGHKCNSCGKEQP